MDNFLQYTEKQTITTMTSIHIKQIEINIMEKNSTYQIDTHWIEITSFEISAAIYRRIGSLSIFYFKYL